MENNNYSFEIHKWMIHSLGLKSASHYVIYAIIYKENPFPMPKLNVPISFLISKSGLTRPTVLKTIQYLVECELIFAPSFLSAGEVKDYILNTKGREVCEWCNKQVHNLQKHHYPIASKDNGKETVSICANCHSAYHIFKKQ